MSSNTQSIAIPTLLAASSIAYVIFKKYEPENVLVFALLLVITPASLVPIVQQAPTTLLVATLTTFATYWSLILVLTVLYRISPFHPLAKYPGPLLCKVSKLWMAHVTASSGKAHIYVQEIHRIYKSDIVRIGPNELSTTNGDFPSAVLGVNGLARGPYYDTRIHEAGMSLDGIRDRSLHTIRHRPWARAMNTANIKHYEGLLSNVVADFIAALSQREGEVINMSEWSMFFGIDFMGQMAFTYDYGMIKNGRDTHGLIRLFESLTREGAWISHISWSLKFLQHLSSATETIDGLKLLGEQTVERRITAGSTAKDLFYHLIDEEGHEPTPPSLELCAVDGLTAIVAGSDTVATVLSHLWYFLVSHPTYFDRLRKEVDEVFPPGADTNKEIAKQMTMPFLNACVNEILRLYPPVLAGLQRRVEKHTGGRVVGSHFVPEDTQVSVWAYVVHRDPQHFSPIPDVFWPDRWLTQETYVLPTGNIISKDEIITNRDVFVPFSQGPMVCVGKSVALMEIRAVACAVVQYFDIEVVDQSCFDSYEDTLCEAFATIRGSLPICLHVRKP
ncbi:high nitrogen upregulated cytochrome P450 monooxygenase 1 [Irpex rosettiformis]|uniref:High nitrogen upregulated cytochrome P450 monooxygenase 1 n=1 Tax=Irpex rosettiformis TaxID=378272 RepID=A0ACB8UGA8_9APHY|nr:high nitrogen upregulated cytochrome P450 monooxygenase 1 [Irpex rosettiformis]